MEKKTIVILIAFVIASIFCSGCINQPFEQTLLTPEPTPSVDQIELITKAAQLSSSVNPGNTNYYQFSIVGTYIEKHKNDNSYEEYYVLYGKITSITGFIFTDSGTTSWTHTFTEPVSITGSIPTTDMVVKVPKDEQTTPSIELKLTIPSYDASKYTAELTVVKGIFDQLHPWLVE